MKVIGMISHDKYICEISHTELEKYLNLYFNNLNHLKVNSIIDLGKGYDFHKEVLEALKKTESFVQSNKDVINTILSGVSILSKADNKTGE